MPLYPAVPFSSGDDWSPEVATLAFNQVFDDQTQYLGHRPRIADTDLSNTTGQIKQRVAAIEEAFKVTVDSGRVLRYQSGVVRLPDGSNLTVASALVTAPDNTTSFVYINQTGSVICDTNPPAIRVLLARVITASGAVSTIEDLRHPALRIVQPIVSAIKVFGGSNTTDKTCTANEVLDQGFYYFRDFIVPPGISVTVDKWAKFFCSGQVDIQGTINITQISAGAAQYSTGVSAAQGNIGGLTGSGIGAGSGSGAGGGSAYPYAAQPYGSGGGLGFANSSSNGSVTFGNAGKGGGGLWIEAAGSVSVSGSILAAGGSASAATIVSGSVNASGAGGGSGGLVYLSSLKAVTVTATATIDVRGSAGAAAVSNITGQGANGGSGGGGGQVVLVSPSNNTTGATILLAGGAVGANAGTAPNLGGGGGGGFGGQGGQQVAGSVGKLIVRPFVPIGS